MCAAICAIAPGRVIRYDLSDTPSELTVKPTLNSMLMMYAPVRALRPSALLPAILANVRSFEPGEDWWWCYAEELVFEVDGAPPAPSHP